MPLALSLSKGQIYVTQQERENHFWVLGSTGEGKSKFLEYLIRKDIDRLRADEHLPKDQRRSCSLCFIDPTPQGKVARLVLNYCAKIGFKKVLYVDPYLLKTHNKVVSINPFHYEEKHVQASVDYLMDAFRVLFEVEDLSRTAMITTYLGALFSLFHYAGLTLSDLIYFTTPFDPDIEEAVEQDLIRRRIFVRIEDKLEASPPPAFQEKILRKHLGDVKFAYKNIPNFAREVGSTARRINQAVTNPALSLIFGHRRGVNFDKLISDGWVLLVNASTGEGMGDLQTRLLATVIINEIIFTIEKLRRHGFNKPYYLYLDEASRYATDELVKVMDLKRNIKMRLIISNQYPSQLKKHKIYDAAKANAKTKIAFHIADPQEREDVVRMLYGGALPDRAVAYALSDQEQREGVFKLGKKEAVVAKTYDIPDAPADKQFLESLLASKNYATPDEIQQDYEQRFKGQDTIRTERGTEPHRRTTKQTDGGKEKHRSKSTQETPRPKTATPETDTDRLWDSVFLETPGGQKKGSN